MQQNYSANVELSLWADGRNVPLAKIGPDFVTLAQPCEIPAGGAIVRMRVDGSLREWSVIIEAVVPFDERVRISDVD